ncbi:hypothetical protein NIES25_66750 (plasmid) [Nostoc linckia NIES-25]|nr:hypothetical protein NIES25_66750 [Nostoc linckia NIES-25]
MVLAFMYLPHHLANHSYSISVMDNEQIFSVGGLAEVLSTGEHDLSLLCHFGEKKINVGWVEPSETQQ